MTVRSDQVAIYEFVFDDGVVSGCGTRAEFDHWSAFGTMDGQSLGKIIGWESAEADERRKAAWARMAA